MPLTNNLRKYFFLSIADCCMHTVPYIVALLCDIYIKLCRISCNHTLSLHAAEASDSSLQKGAYSSPRLAPLHAVGLVSVAVEGTDATAPLVTLLSRHVVSKHQLLSRYFQLNDCPV